MLDVSRVSIGSSSVGSDLRSAEFFESVIGKQKQWNGGQHNAAHDAAGFETGNVAVKESAEQAPAQVKFEKSNLHKEVWRNFYATNTSYFPSIDYSALHRETSLFESLKGKAEFSSSRTRTLRA